MSAGIPATDAVRRTARDERHNCRDTGSPERGPDFLDCALASRFVIAVVMFAVSCGLAATFNLGKEAPTDFPERTWASWSIADLLTVKQRPQLVFMGSSLMLVPLEGADANLLHKRIDGCEHHKSAYFERAYKEATGSDVRTFNLAMPGEMPSDAYFITDFLMEGRTKPDVIVYGLGPRDFMDNILPSPAATDPFRSLARFGDISHMIDRVMPEWTDKLNFELGKVVYLYGLREDIAAQSGSYLSAMLNNYLPVPAGKKPTTVALRRALLPQYRSSQLNRGEAYFRPGEKEQFADNIEEYRKRYAQVKWDTFTTQMRFFVEMLDIAREREIKVVIVSMPITDINRSLIKDYAWDAYRQSVRVLATIKGATYIDLQGSGKFNLADFMDTVHLNSAGGKKMLDALVSGLAETQPLRTALRGENSHVPAGQVARLTGRNGDL